MVPETGDEGIWLLGQISIIHSSTTTTLVASGDEQSAAFAADLEEARKLLEDLGVTEVVWEHEDGSEELIAVGQPLRAGAELPH